MPYRRSLFEGQSLAVTLLQLVMFPLSSIRDGGRKSRGSDRDLECGHVWTSRTRHAVGGGLTIWFLCMLDIPELCRS